MNTDSFSWFGEFSVWKTLTVGECKNRGSVKIRLNIHQLEFCSTGTEPMPSNSPTAQSCGQRNTQANSKRHRYLILYNIFYLISFKKKKKKKGIWLGFQILKLTPAEAAAAWILQHLGAQAETAGGVRFTAEAWRVFQRPLTDGSGGVRSPESARSFLRGAPRGRRCVVTPT